MSGFLLPSERVICISRAFEPMLGVYRALHEPVLPLYVLAGLVDLDFTSTSSTSNSRDLNCGGDGESGDKTTTSTTAVEVTFTSWDPIILRNLLLIWNRQAQAQSQSQSSHTKVPKSNIILKIEGADTTRGFPDDVVLHTAFPRLKNLEFESIYLRLPEVSLPVRTAMILEGSMPGMVRRWKVERKGGEVCAYYEF